MTPWRQVPRASGRPASSCRAIVIGVGPSRTRGLASQVHLDTAVRRWRGWPDPLPRPGHIQPGALIAANEAVLSHQPLMDRAGPEPALLLRPGVDDHVPLDHLCRSGTAAAPLRRPIGDLRTGAEDEFVTR
jgi:hypothetical protein